jgi:hypothetical protein
MPGLVFSRNVRMSRNRRQIYEGKAKILFEGPEPGTIVQYFKDDATAFNTSSRACRTSASRPTSSAD